jgi:hypothetical protein
MATTTTIQIGGPLTPIGMDRGVLLDRSRHDFWQETLELQLRATRDEGVLELGLYSCNFAAACSSWSYDLHVLTEMHECMDCRLARYTSLELVPMACSRLKAGFPVRVLELIDLCPRCTR